MTHEHDDSILTAYEGRGASWASGPERVYDRFAVELIRVCPLSLRGASVLDLGAGTGAASRAVAAAGGHPIALDAAFDMLVHNRRAPARRIVGDALALPFGEGAFDAVAAAFSISHVDDPTAALREARRVTRGGGAVIASVFSAAEAHPSKPLIDAAAERFGFRYPGWYVHLKAHAEPLTSEESALAAVASAAGLAEVQVVARRIDVGLSRPDDLIQWRFGMAHLAPFVESLDAATRAALVREARTAIGEDPSPLQPEVLLMSSRVPPARM
jgi:ubiquinone/menaquinone biosynthesis C-methylase UbiE